MVSSHTVQLLCLLCVPACTAGLWVPGQMAGTVLQALPLIMAAAKYRAPPGCHSKQGGHIPRLPSGHAVSSTEFHVQASESPDLLTSESIDLPASTVEPVPLRALKKWFQVSLLNLNPQRALISQRLVPQCCPVSQRAASQCLRGHHQLHSPT
ncbi:hypothetical protein MHYP_G00020840 [Metynnis hypsauchen]